MTNALVTFAAAVALTGVQLVPRLLDRLSESRRRRLHSAAGGVAVAFVFLHLFPEIDDLRDQVTDRLTLIAFEEVAVFVLALVGLVCFYGIETFARRSHDEGEAAVATWPDHVAFGVFTAYYGAIGYLLWDEIERGAGSLILYTVAMGLHFLVVDHGLRETHREAYRRAGRWMLAVAVVVGWAVGWISQVPEWGVGVLLSLFAGALVLVALKEELPAERNGHYPSFLVGAASYAALLAAVGAVGT